MDFPWIQRNLLTGTCLRLCSGGHSPWQPYTNWWEVMGAAIPPVPRCCYARGPSGRAEQQHKDWGRALSSGARESRLHLEVLLWQPKQLAFVVLWVSLPCGPADRSAPELCQAGIAGEDTCSVISPGLGGAQLSLWGGLMWTREGS